jgi:lipid A disaccharide synthetase
MKWFDKTYIEWASKLNITWVSIDSPDFPLNVYRKARQESYGLTLG